MRLLRWLMGRRSEGTPPGNGHDDRIQESQRRQERQARALARARAQMKALGILPPDKPQ